MRGPIGPPGPPGVCMCNASMIFGPDSKMPELLPGPPGTPGKDGRAGPAGASVSTNCKLLHFKTHFVFKL